MIPATISVLQKKIHDTAVSKGWWDDTPETPLRTFGDCIALIHSEVSEALEEFRNGHKPNEVYYTPVIHNTFGITGKPEGVPIELADIVIRVMDLAGRHNIDLEAAILEKMTFNDTRPVRHGGKAL